MCCYHYPALFRGAATLLLATAIACGAEFHVSSSGSDANPGTQGAPFLTIQHAADAAQPGDTVTVHAGVYRERINPPRGGTSDANRIVFQAAPGEAVTIKGSEIVTGWQYLSNDTWTVTLPYGFFGGFNPFNNTLVGDWFTAGNGGNNHSAQVYLNGDWLIEASSQSAALQPASGTSKWFATVDGGGSLMNVERFQPFKGATAGANADASLFDAGSGVIDATSSEGGQCVGYIEDGDWTRYTNVVFGTNADSIQVRAASATIGGRIEVRLGTSTGTLLGVCTVANTGGWQTWQNFTASITPTSGTNTVCLVYRFPPSATGNTTIWAQFPGKNPNNEPVEVNVRQSVFYPDQAGHNYITVRGFTLEQAATPWAPPTAEQIGIIGPHWSLGWIIESNTVCYSTCSGVSLGKYGDHYDNTATAAPDSAVAYVGTINRALTNGWQKGVVGSHIVRGNHIYNCEQTGIVGSLGTVFSTIIGNHIHNIHVRGLFGGAEIAGIKFHGAIDVEISHNHIHNDGSFGIWLDWMAQGARISGNQFYNNSQQDLFMEVDHGPFMVDDNLFLSSQSLYINSQGGAFVHNLFAGNMSVISYDSRQTPYHQAHSTAVVALHDNPNGDMRFYNNIYIQPGQTTSYNSPTLPVWLNGNVYLNGAAASTQETSPLVLSSFNPSISLISGFGGYYLQMNSDPAWGPVRTRPLVTTALLGNASIPNLPYEHSDGTPYKFDGDFLGAPRNTNNPFPGPFETVLLGTNVWKVFDDASVTMPSGLTASSGLSKVLLNWGTFYGAASYSVKRASVSGGPYTTLVTGLTNSAWTDSAVTNGLTYFYVVSASDGVTEGANSTEASVMPQAAIRINCGGVATGNFSADAWSSGGNAYANGNAITTNGVANAAPPAVYQSERWGVYGYTVPGLDPGTNYLVRLHFAEIYFSTAGSRIWNVLVNGSIVLTNFDAFAAAGAANKAVVRDFTATADSSGQITIALATVVSNPKISGFEILPLPVPPPPTGLAAVPGYGQVNLNWTASTAAVAYRVWRSDASNGTYAVVGSTAGTQFSDSNVTSGQTYYYSVSATNGVGESANSTPVGVTFVAASGAVWTNRASGSWTLAANWLSNTIANGSGVAASFNLLTLASNVVVTLDSSPTVGSLLFGDGGNLYGWTVNPGSGGTLTLSATNPPVIQVDNQTTAIGVALAGTNGLLKTGQGTLTLSAANTLTGPTIISQGKLSLNAATALPTSANVILGDTTSAGTSPTLGVTYATTLSSLTVAAGVSNATLYATPNGTVFATFTNLVLNSPLTISKANMGGNWQGVQTLGSGNMTGPGGGAGNDSLILMNAGGSQAYWQGNNVANNFLGNVHIKTGDWRIQNTGGNNLTIPDTASVTVDSGAFLYFSTGGLPETVDGLNGGGTVAPSVGLNSVLTIGAAGGSGNFSGVLGNGSGTMGLTKIGLGTQILSGANIYTGATVLSNGMLAVNGSLASGSTVSVRNGGTLCGTGIVGGAVTVQGGGIIAPGLNGIGNLTLNASPSLGGTALLEISKGATTNADKLIVSGQPLTYAGTLTVTNIGTNPLAAGDSFMLFSATGFGGSFAVTNLPPLTSGFGWVWTPANGTLSVVATVAMNPTNLTFSVSGSTLTLTWPADHLGWHLQFQTNALTSGLGTNWIAIAGSQNTTSMNIQIDATKPTVFYRLMLP